MYVWHFESSLGLQVIDVKDLKITACQLMYVYLYESRVLKV